MAIPPPPTSDSVSYWWLNMCHCPMYTCWFLSEACWTIFHCARVGKERSLVWFSDSIMSFRFQSTQDSAEYVSSSYNGKSRLRQHHPFLHALYFGHLWFLILKGEFKGISQWWRCERSDSCIPSHNQSFSAKAIDTAAPRSHLFGRSPTPFGVLWWEMRTSRVLWILIMHKKA